VLNVWYLTLPAIALGLRIAALIARMTRAVMLDVMQEALYQYSAGERGAGTAVLTAPYAA
jgi:ABC-type dipeptide/oligopeptide/nickel transport system permease component